MLKFPSIDSFRHAVASVKRAYEYHGKPLPKITYQGTVKLHGTNAGIYVDLINKKLIAQSRERVLSVDSDNAGFAAWVQSNHDTLFDFFVDCFVSLPNEAGFTVFGEWVGPGIQKNVGINLLPEKLFVVMNVAFDDDIVNADDGQTLCIFHQNFLEFVPKVMPKGVDVITRVPVVRIIIDFAQPDLVVADLERLTSEYEENCPFAKLYGIDGIGEGLVWTPAFGDDIIPLSHQHRMWFKTKGEKHGNKGTNNKVKVAVTAEQIADFNELLDKIMPEWRLQQGMSKLSEANAEVTRVHTGEFIKWVVGDVHKEELDTVEASAFEWKVVAGELSKRARNWFLTKV